MSTLRRIQAAMKRMTISDLIPVFAHDDDSGLFVMHNHDDLGRQTGVDLGAAWYGVPATGIDHQTISDIEELFMLDVPGNTVLQFQRLATSNVEQTIRNYGATKERPLALANQNGLTVSQKKNLQRMTRQRMDFLRQGKVKPLIKDTNHLLKEEILLITAKVPCKAEPTAKDVEKTAALMGRIEGQLKKINVHPKRMTPHAYIHMVSSILRMGEVTDVEYDDSRPINEQVSCAEDYLQCTADDVRLNDRWIRSVSAERYPSRTHLRMMLPLFGDVIGSNRQIGDPYLATATIIIPEHTAAQDKAAKNRLWVQNLNRGQIAKISDAPKLLYEEHKKLEAALHGDASICKIWVNYLTFSESAEAAGEAAQNFKTMARGFGWLMKEDRFMHGPFLQQNLPLCADYRVMADVNRYHTKASKHVAHLIPIVGEWAGNSVRPTQLYISRRGALISMNAWDSGEGYNILTAGGTGGGKSVWIQDFALNNLAQGVKVNLLDKGRSFEKMVLDNEGEYFDFVDAGVYNLNPFLQIRDLDEETESISLIIQTMADTTGMLDNVQKPVLEKIIREGYGEHGTECTIDWVAERCRKDGDQRIQDLGEMLVPYTRRGQHGRWFSEGKPLSFGSNMLTAMELSGLDSKPKLQAVVLQMVLMELLRLMFIEGRKPNGIRSMTIVDECRDLLKDPGPAAFAEISFRQARKFGSGIALVSQLLSDYRDMPCGRALVANAAHLVLLRQKQSVVAELKQENYAGLSDYEIHMLNNVTTVPGRYSEALFKTPDGSGVGRLVLSRYDQLLYTTQEDEVKRIQAHRDAGKSVGEAIEAVIEEERQSGPVRSEAVLHRKSA